jgi:hypothetical protein
MSKLLYRSGVVTEFESRLFNLLVCMSYNDYYNLNSLSTKTINLNVWLVDNVKNVNESKLISYLKALKG